jgi:DNA-directed RNA polymerase sigma subunit (sigma70/sigma32)
MDLLGCRVMGVTPLSFAEIGRRLGISRERVRQIAERLEAG